jgi:hypothetical protein
MRFRDLLEKRTADPVKLAQRIGKRYGTEHNYGYDNSDTKLGKYIPLKNFNDDLVDGMEEARHQLYIMMGYKASKNNLKEIRLKLESQFGYTENISINQLFATQPFVRIEDAETLKQKVASNKKITVVKYLNKFFIVDGHHATLAAKLRKENSVMANVIDLDTAIDQIQGK